MSISKHLLRPAFILALVLAGCDDDEPLVSDAARPIDSAADVPRTDTATPTDVPRVDAVADGAGDTGSDARTDAATDVATDVRTDTAADTAVDLRVDVPGTDVLPNLDAVDAGADAGADGGDGGTDV